MNTLASLFLLLPSCCAILTPAHLGAWAGQPCPPGQPLCPAEHSGREQVTGLRANSPRTSRTSVGMLCGHRPPPVQACPETAFMETLTPALWSSCAVFGGHGILGCRCSSLLVTENMGVTPMILSEGPRGTRHALPTPLTPSWPLRGSHMDSY